MLLSSIYLIVFFSEISNHYRALSLVPCQVCTSFLVVLSRCFNYKQRCEKFRLEDLSCFMNMFIGFRMSISMQFTKMNIQLSSSSPRFLNFFDDLDLKIILVLALQWGFYIIPWTKSRNTRFSTYQTRTKHSYFETY